MPKVKTIGLGEYTMMGFKRLNNALKVGLEQAKLNQITNDRRIENTLKGDISGLVNMNK